MQVIRSGQKLAGKKAGNQKQGGGFFSGWFGRKAKKEQQELEENQEPESKSCSGSSEHAVAVTGFLRVLLCFRFRTGPDHDF